MEATSWSATAWFFLAFRKYEPWVDARVASRFYVCFPPGSNQQIGIQNVSPASWKQLSVWQWLPRTPEVVRSQFVQWPKIFKHLHTLPNSFNKDQQSILYWYSQVCHGFASVVWKLYCTCMNQWPTHPNDWKPSKQVKRTGLPHNYCEESEQESEND